MDSQLSNQFIDLDCLLQKTSNLWRFEPFQQSFHLDLPWQQTHPELCQFLNELTENDIFRLKQDTSDLIALLTPYIPELNFVVDLCQLELLKSEELVLPQGFDVGIPGRKWQQVCAMGWAALKMQFPDDSGEWLEWCAGKGYLGQVIAQQSQRLVTSLEWQNSLCHSGQVLADKRQLMMSFVQGDALSQEVKLIMKPNQHAVALHACGDLHAHLIELAQDVDLSALTISPCCYHLTQFDTYQALSVLGKKSSLLLSKNELRIPLQETVTGGKRVQLHRRQEMTYRLAVDCLLREELGERQYTPLPSIKKSELSLGFEHFCCWANQQPSYQNKQLCLPLDDLDISLVRGEQRFIQMERVSLVQQVFRRALEMWLVYDKALRLEQDGYLVSLSLFCTRDITPRNILIQAQKRNR
ncbi:methyltransferase [Vibrio sp. S17_S38]|uniref:methyltransferase n=1 Tax=Vibrio sp. S17_S38 TaxID=2720229 RepID=UPI0016804886|nr:methyltransferase [Vibrio sp. S17_S38]